jgi:hypothetical protein
VPSPGAVAQTRADLRILPSYLSGDFGTGVDSDITYVPFIVAVRGQRQDFRLTVPWLSIRTSEPITFVGGDVIRRDTGGVTEASGPGDIVAEHEVYFVRGGAGRPWVSGGVRVKFPIADESRGLGTGEYDYGPTAAIIQPLGATWHLLGEVRYVVRGDPPGIDYRNTWWLAGGFQKRLAEGTHLSVILDNRQSVLRGRDTIRDLTLGFDRRLTPAVGLRSAAYVGLSETAEDFGLAVGLAFRGAPSPAP